MPCRRPPALAAVLVAGIALAAAAPLAIAADPGVPDMVGTWKLKASAIIIGGGAHHPAAEDSKPRLREFEATFQVIGQEGDRFWGALSSPTYTEDVVATFTGEGGRFIAVDSDGFWNGEVLGPGNARACYQQVDAHLHTASCGTLTRE
jgi:hypothetical protein